MADIERTLLYATTGFLGALFIMTRVSALRPATAKSKSMAYSSRPEDWTSQPYESQPYPPRKWIGEHPS